ncbi:alpha/beta fold hydrolase [Sphingomonas arantia]|uniref:Alpha/beta fold hydrolase n=1 Tax=Sphingomonas arantia TaxID=1460676 RepID=A0ABW4U1I0_9SPHN
MTDTANSIGTAPAAGPTTSIVLVHGAFVDASGWQPVYADLVGRGFEVLVVQHPTITLADDVAVTERAIAAARHPVILVGHSYGGAVITEAGAHPRVAALVYLAAFAPAEGGSVAALTSAPPEPGEAPAPVLPPQDGFLIVDPARFAQAFAADVDRATTRFMAAAQLPWGLGAVTATIGRAAWRTKPSHYMVATSDLMIPPRAQRMMAERIGATMVEVDSSHAVMLSHPREVADLIATAAATVG